MHIEDIDRICDQYEEQLKNTPLLTPSEFCEQQQLTQDTQLLTELRRVANEYQASSEPESTATMASSIANGETIGPYKLLQPIGEGGMGVVFMAEQEMPVRRKVALKVIKPGLGSKEVIARFESERQALALMDHPNIARMFDAGTTNDGRPYFVMELVRGLPLTKYCDDNKLSIRARLELFVKVCEAVQHAHQKGIIHRDIKPSNVLISNYDGRPVPKVIDFGVAKALQQKLTDKTLFTEFGKVIGTVQYMSPEQAGLSELDIDTRSDIYSLGVLLYELLTGSTPIDKQHIREIGWERVMQVIREEEPKKPSTRISESGDALSDISLQRHSNPSSLGSLVRGDLDWIVMKSLEKDRSRRYETADGFAVDIQRHLNDEPVSAGPPRAGYRLRKFVRRNRVAVLVGSLVATVVAIAIIGVTGGFVWALQERQIAKERTTEAEARFDLAMNAIEKYHTGVSQDVHLKQPELEDLRNSLLRSALQFYEQLARDLQGARTPKQKDDLGKALYELAELTRLIGLTEDALLAFRELVEFCQIRVNQHPEVSRFQEDLAVALTGFGNLQQATGDLTGARKSHESVINIRKSLVRQYPAIAKYRAGLAGGFINLGILQKSTDDPSGARTSYTQAIEFFEQLQADYPDSNSYVRRLGGAYINLGNLQKSTDDLSGARASYQKAIAKFDRIVGRAPRDSEYQWGLAIGCDCLAKLQDLTGELPEARQSYLRAIEILENLVEQKPTFTDYQWSLAKCYYNLAGVKQGSGDPRNARQLLLKAIDVYERLVGQNPSVAEYQFSLAAAYHRLGTLQQQLGDYPKARKSYEDAIENFKEIVLKRPTYNEYQVALGKTLNDFGTLMQWTENFQRAHELFQEAVAVFDRLVDNALTEREHLAGLSTAYVNLGNLQAMSNDLPGAGESFQEAIASYEQLVDQYSSIIHYQSGLANTYGSYGNVQHATNEIAGARKSYQTAIGIYEKLVADFPKQSEIVIGLSGVLINYANLVRKDDESPLESLKHFERAINNIEETLGQSPNQVEGRSFLFRAYVNRAITYDDLLRHTDAASDWGRAAKLDSGPTGPALLVSQSLSLARSGDYLKATTVAKKVASTELYDAACVYSLCIRAVAEDTELEKKERQRLVDLYGKQAVELLQQAADERYFDNSSRVRHMQQDKDLDPIRDRGDFKMLMERIEKKTPNELKSDKQGNKHARRTSTVGP